MNINLNLATRPYFELRPVYARLRVAALVLALLALPMLLVLHTVQTRAQVAQARTEQLQEKIALLQRQQAQARALTQGGTNAEVLTQAAFLNDLFRRKSFSWTATMTDLENVLPGGVEVQAIDPIIAPDGRVTIHMRVTGARERAVEVVNNLERSRHFLAPHVPAEALNSDTGTPQVRQAGNANDVNFDISADYRPLPLSHERPLAPRRSAVRQPAPAQLTNPQVLAPPPPPARRRPEPFGKPLPVIPAPLGER